MSDDSLKARLTAAMKDAMRAGDKDRLGVIRMANAAIKQVEVDTRAELDEAAVIAVLDKMVKQRRESISQYEQGGRPELAEREAAEVTVIQEFLPAALGDEEVDALIEAAVAESGATSMKDMGKVMAMLKPQLQGRADMGAVSGKIKARLAG